MLKKQLKTNLLNLPAVEKLEAIELLSNSLDKPDPVVEEIIARESERRFAAYKSGKMKARNLASVLNSYS